MSDCELKSTHGLLKSSKNICSNGGGGDVEECVYFASVLFLIWMFTFGEICVQISRKMIQRHRI